MCEFVGNYVNIPHYSICANYYLATLLFDHKADCFAMHKFNKFPFNKDILAIPRLFRIFYQKHATVGRFLKKAGYNSFEWMFQVSFCFIK